RFVFSASDLRRILEGLLCGPERTVVSRRKVRLDLRLRHERHDVRDVERWPGGGGQRRIAAGREIGHGGRHVSAQGSWSGLSGTWIGASGRSKRYGSSDRCVATGTGA